MMPSAHIYATASLRWNTSSPTGGRGVTRSITWVTRERDIWAIEVKSGRSGKTFGLTRFRDRYPQARALLVGGQGILLETFVNRDAVSWLV
jgi:hypothetical protein